MTDHWTADVPPSDRPIFSTNVRWLLADLGEALRWHGITVTLQDEVLVVDLGEGVGFTVDGAHVSSVVAGLDDWRARETWENWRTDTVALVLQRWAPTHPWIAVGQLRLRLHDLHTAGEGALLDATDLGVLADGIGIRLTADVDGELVPVPPSQVSRLGGLDAVWDEATGNLSQLDPVVRADDNGGTQTRIVVRESFAAGFLAHPAAALEPMAARQMLDLDLLAAGELFIAAPTADVVMFDLHPRPPLAQPLKTFARSVADQYFGSVGSGKEVSPHVFVLRDGALSVAVHAKLDWKAEGGMRLTVDQELVPTVDTGSRFGTAPAAMTPDVDISRLRVQLGLTEALEVGALRLSDELTARLVWEKPEGLQPIDLGGVVAAGGLEEAWTQALANLELLNPDIDGFDAGGVRFRRLTQSGLAGGYLASPGWGLGHLIEAGSVSEDELTKGTIFLAAPTVDDLFVAVHVDGVEYEHLTGMATSVHHVYSAAVPLGRQASPWVFWLGGQNRLGKAAVVEGDELVVIDGLVPDEVKAASAPSVPTTDIDR